jgi:hypothetical protein
MMAIDFPDSPSVNDTFTAGGKVYQWDGTVWEIYGPNVSPGTFKIDDVNNRVGIGTSTPGYALHVDGDVGFNDAATANFFVSSGTGANLMPSGTTAERPASPTAGMFRFNETTGEPEWYSSFAGWLNFRSSPLFELTYLVVAGGGGTGSASANGADSSFGNITSVGGGAGGADGGTVGSSGGSGGGGGGGDGFRAGGSGTTAQGFNGGSGSGTSGLSDNRAGGGGGASEAGTGGVVEGGIGRGGDGGDGVQSSIDGTATYRAGGGVGTGHNSGGGLAGTPGLGGGGAKATAGGVNTGGGAGGSSAYQGGGGAGGYRSSVQGEMSGGGASAESVLTVLTGQSLSVVVGAGGSGSVNGGSGVVILRYQSGLSPTVSAGLTSTTTTVGSDKVTTITAGTGTVSWS